MKIIHKEKIYETDECECIHVQFTYPHGPYTETFKSKKGNYFEVYMRPFSGMRLISEIEAFNKLDNRDQIKFFPHLLNLEQG